ncbi:hypothetical protein LTR15_004993 [Elasticomyces elasticus]|nr:hypothetical protein LTR15_004993 [Elasticomyces elasticus]
MGAHKDRLAMLYWCDKLQISIGAGNTARRNAIAEYTSRIFPHALAPYYIVKEAVGHTDYTPSITAIHARLEGEASINKYSDETLDWAQLDYVDVYSLAVQRVRFCLQRAASLAEELGIDLQAVPKMPPGLDSKQQVGIANGYIAMVNHMFRAQSSFGPTSKTGYHKKFSGAKQELLKDAGFAQHFQRIVDEGKQKAAGPAIIREDASGVANAEHGGDAHEQDHDVEEEERRTSRKRKAGWSAGFEGRKRRAATSEYDDDEVGQVSKEALDAERRLTKKRKAGSSASVQSRKRSEVSTQNRDASTGSTSEQTQIAHAVTLGVGERSTRAKAAEVKIAVKPEEEQRVPSPRKVDVKEDVAAPERTGMDILPRPAPALASSTLRSERSSSAAKAPPLKTTPSAASFVDLTMDDEAASVSVKQEANLSGGEAIAGREIPNFVGVDEEDEDDVRDELEILEIEEKKLKCKQKLRRMQKKARAETERSG